MRNLEQLKESNINELTIDELNEVKSDVLSLDDEQVKEYLEFILDEQVPVLDENENWDEKIDNFLRSEEFKPFFVKIREENEIEETETEVESTGKEE
jgi:hypothetical protein